MADTRNRNLRNTVTSYNKRLNHSLRRRGGPNSDRSPVNPFLKHALFVWNFFLLFIGLGVGALGTYILVLKEKRVSSFADFLFDPACIFTLVGSIAFFISFFGCGGSLRESILFLRLYYGLTSIFLLIQIVIVIFVFIFYFWEEASDRLNLYPQDTFLDAIKKYRSENSEDLQTFIDDIQKKFECCGASNDEKGYEDWNLNPYFNCSGTAVEACAVPFSCCKHSASDNINYQCGHNALRENFDLGQIYTDGCLRGIYLFIANNIWFIGGAIIAVFLPQAFCICFSKALVEQIQEQMSKWR